MTSRQAASRLESAGYAVRAEGDDRVAIDPWNTALRLTAELSEPTAAPGT